MDTAEGDWNYIKNGIAEINDDSRCSNVLKDFKSRVTKAIDSFLMIMIVFEIRIY